MKMNVPRPMLRSFEFLNKPSLLEIISLLANVNFPPKVYLREHCTCTYLL